jgi:hypothetical protein
MRGTSAVYIFQPSIWKQLENKNYLISIECHTRAKIEGNLLMQDISQIQTI